MIRKREVDILVIGMGGAAEMAVLSAFDANPALKILIVTKALKGKGGCSRMVQGGFNVVLNDYDSHDLHLMDTLQGGQYINDQELAVTLVENATNTIKDMEIKYGCFFDRNADGTIHQKAFAGQSFDRTVHKGDLTGIEIISRLTEQIAKRNIEVLEEHRALDLLLDPSGEEVVGALVVDIRRGSFLEINAKATLVATGGGPTHYRFFAPGPEKSVDGLGMLYRAGVLMRDMEMVQFHPTGLIIPNSVVAGSLLEEGLRGAGAYMLNGVGERFMERYDPERMERTTRDIMSRSSYMEIQEGRACKEGGVHIDASHLGAKFVEDNFPGMCSRCKQFRYDLAREPVPVSPSAHYIMGGAAIDKRGRSSKRRLFVAGEDSGGVHGSNRLGGNGICDSCVFGRLAGKAIIKFLEKNQDPPSKSINGMAEELADYYMQPIRRQKGESLFEIRDQLRELNWDSVGVARQASDLSSAGEKIQEMAKLAGRVKVEGTVAFNMPWNIHIDLLNMIEVSGMVSESAILREETRGAHFRVDYPEQNDTTGLFNIYQNRGPDGKRNLHKKPVDFKYISLKDCQEYKK